MPNNTSVAAGITRVPASVLKDAIYKCLACEIDDKYSGAVMFDTWNDDLVLVASDMFNLVIVKLAGADGEKPSQHIRLTPATLQNLSGVVDAHTHGDAVFVWERKQCYVADVCVDLETDDRAPPLWREIVNIAADYGRWFTASALRNLFAGLNAAHCSLAVCTYSRKTKQLKVEARTRVGVGRRKRLRMLASCYAFVKGRGNIAFAVKVERMHAILQRINYQRVRLGNQHQPLAFDFPNGVAFLMPSSLKYTRLGWQLREPWA
jgi:hypothetical protein